MWDDVVEEETPAPEPAPEAAAAADAPAAAADKPEVAEPPPPENITYGTEPKKLIFKHWIRPTATQYNYITNYRQNYYNDLISFLDHRNQGLPVERPRAQTWGERALRSYLANTPRTPAKTADARLLHCISTGARFHRYHSKSLISRKYSRLGFNIVSI